jgi:hypothetical protein
LLLLLGMRADPGKIEQRVGDSEGERERAVKAVGAGGDGVQREEQSSVVAVW